MPKAMLGSLGSQAERLERIEEAALATQSAAYLAEPLQKRQAELVTALINMYRSGKVDHDVLIGTVGELSGLDYIMRKLENTRLQGEIAAEKEFNRA